jgi:hypothetical protein
MASVTVNADASRLEAFAKRGGDALRELGEVSEKKVGGQIANLGRQLFLAQSAGDALASTAHVLEKTFNLGMGATVAIAGGVALYEMFKKNREEAEQLEKAAAKAMDFTEYGNAVAPLSAVQGKLKEINEQIAENQKKLKEHSGTGALFLDSVLNALNPTVGFGEETTRADEHAEKLAELEAARARLIQDATRSANEEYQLSKQLLENEKEWVDLIKTRAKYEQEIRDLRRVGATEAATLKAQERDNVQALMRREHAQKREDLFNENHFAGKVLTAEGSLYSNPNDQKRELNEIKIAELEEKINVARKRGGALVEETIGKLSLEAEKLREQNELLRQQEKIQAALLQERRSLEAYEGRKSREAIERQRSDVADLEGTEGSQRRRLELHQREREAKRKEDEARKKLEWSEWAKGKNSPEAEQARGEMESARVEQQQVSLQWRDLRRDERREGWRLDADLEKANLRTRGTARQKQELDIDLKRLQQEHGDTADPMKRRGLEVEIARNKQQQFELEHKTGADQTVSSSLARIGGGGYSFSYRDPVASRIDRTNRLLEQIHATLNSDTHVQHAKGAEAFDRRFTLAK